MEERTRIVSKNMNIIWKKTHPLAIDNMKAFICTIIYSKEFISLQIDLFFTLPIIINNYFCNAHKL